MATTVFLKDDTHQYFDNHGVEYQSVSSFLNLFSKKFDKEGISKLTAAKQGISQEEVIAGWDKTRDDAIDHGNRIHDNLEAYMKTTQILPGGESLLPLAKSISAEYSQYYRTFQEEIIFSEEHLLSGKTDNRFQHTSSKNSLISFGDFKTNQSKGIQFENKYGQYMLGPLSHLQDCNFIKYSLQLSLYAYMFQQNTGCKIGNLHIMFIPPHNHLAWKKIYVPYMLRDVEAMLQWKKENAIIIETPVKKKSVLSNFGGD